MKNQITVLIIASLLGLLALSAIQGYLINNTYKLKKSTFLERVTARYSNVEDHSSAMDSIKMSWYTSLKRLVIAHHNDALSRDSLTTRLRQEVSWLDHDYAAAYREYPAEATKEEGLKFQKRLVGLILLDSLKNDTILSAEKGQRILLLGETFTDGLAQRLGRTTSQTSVSLDANLAPGEIPEVIRYLVVTDNLVSIEGWNLQVLGELRNLLLASVLLFSFVFGLLYYSIKTLITQKKIAEVKTDFVNNITHEFKTPLATLSIATKMLGGIDMPTDKQEIIAVIERQNARLQKLTDEVVNHALSYQEISLKKEQVNAGNYLTSLLDDFELSLGEGRIAMLRSINVNGAFFRLDKFYLTSALLNLLDNAVKYNDAPVCLTVSATQKDGLEIKIMDNGKGIAAEHLPHVFNKFYRIGNREVHDVKGLGLGLYFTRQVVKAHGGEIRIASKEGEGTCFTVHLPSTIK